METRRNRIVTVLAFAGGVAVSGVLGVVFAGGLRSSTAQESLQEPDAAVDASPEASRSQQAAPRPGASASSKVPSDRLDVQAQRATVLEQDTGARSSQPQLRFLSSHHRPRSQTPGIEETKYWLPDGRAVTDRTQLAPIRNLSGWDEALFRGERRFLYLFVSCEGGGDHVYRISEWVSSISDARKSEQSRSLFSARPYRPSTLFA